MKPSTIGTNERTFVAQTVKTKQRCDGRKNEEFRPVQIHLGADWGSAIVSLGATKVLAQVSCELGIPKATRPHEGMMHINVELGAMTGQHLDSGRNSDVNVQLCRTLERTFKDSRCVDLESLCVTAEEHVWILRVDVNVLNYDGNLIDCCSIATLCALAHFRRPDVSIIEDDVHIHTAAEKDPIPIVLHHYPVCITYCTFDEGRIAVADPTALEERVAESTMVFGLNSFRELCCLNLGGTTLTSSNLLLQCSARAANQAKIVVDHVRKTLEDDKVARAAGERKGFKDAMHNNFVGSAEERLALRLRNFNFSNLKKNKKCGTLNAKHEDESAPEVIVTSNANESQDDIPQWLPEPTEDAEDDIEDDDDDNHSNDKPDNNDELLNRIAGWVPPRRNQLPLNIKRNL